MVSRICGQIAERGIGLGAQPCCQYAAAVSADLVKNFGYLFGCFASRVDHLGAAGPLLAVVVHDGMAKIAEEVLTNFRFSFVNRQRAVLKLLQQFVNGLGCYSIMP